MKELLNFDWLLRVKKSDPFFILIIFQPLYIIWIYKVGRLGEKMLIRKRNWLFSLSCFWVLISIFLFIIILENKDLLNYLGNYKELSIYIFGWSLCAFWLYATLYVTAITIKLDELRDENYHPLLVHKIYRFFLLIYWIIGLFTLQSRINESYDSFIKS